MINNLNSLINFTNEMYIYLISKGMKFNENGFPIFDKSYFLFDYPDIIIPIQHWKSKFILNKKRTCLCFYCDDKFIYRRIDKIFDEINIYKEYMGIIEPDLTVTSDMDEEWQKFIILINQLILAFFCINGIKCIPNTRIGNDKMLILLNNFPKNIMFSSSFLGCKNTNSFESNDRYINKVLTLLPSGLVLYGKKNLVLNHKLSYLGFDFKQYRDFHSLSAGAYNV